MENLTLVCLSDTHSKFVEVPQGDILIHCGDFTNWGFEQEVREFITWIKAQPHKHKIVIPGNHDVSLDLEKYATLKNKFHRYHNLDEKKLLSDLKECCHLLINESVTVEGYKFWGSPYSQEYCDWAFQIEGNSSPFWEKIDSDSDIILTHGPPHYYGDRISNGFRVGDRHLAEKVKSIKPKYHIFGGIHEGYGKYREDGGIYDDDITFVNCCIMDQWFKVANKPILIELPKR